MGNHCSPGINSSFAGLCRCNCVCLKIENTAFRLCGLPQNWNPRFSFFRFASKLKSAFFKCLPLRIQNFVERACRSNGCTDLLREGAGGYWDLWARNNGCMGPWARNNGCMGPSLPWMGPTWAPPVFTVLTWRICSFTFAPNGWVPMGPKTNTPWFKVGALDG